MKIKAMKTYQAVKDGKNQETYFTVDGTSKKRSKSIDLDSGGTWVTVVTQFDATVMIPFTNIQYVEPLNVEVESVVKPDTKTTTDIPTTHDDKVIEVSKSKSSTFSIK